MFAWFSEIGNHHSFASASLVILLAGTLAFFQFESFSEKNEIRYSFQTTWYDSMAGIVRNLQLIYFPHDSSIELYDTKAKKLFLKRYPVSDLEEKDFYVGNTVVILSRQLKIIDYVDDFTKNEISRRRQKTFAMVKPDAVHKIGDIVQLIYSKGFEITQMRMVQLTQSQAETFYSEHFGRTFFEGLVNYITSGPVIAMELIGNEAVQYWRKILGPTDSNLARSEDPESLRAQFGTDKQENAAHGSDSYAAATRELNYFFPVRDSKQGISIKSVALFKNNTCCIIKPHAISEGNLGAILTAIYQEQFHISALQMFRINRAQAEEFLEVYKDVLPEYPRMVQQLITGPLVALEITSPNDDENTAQKFRDFVGPMDPEVARELRPHSLRARFGTDKVRNGVHCSDLPEDGPLEVEYFFKILQ